MPPTAPTSLWATCPPIISSRPSRICPSQDNECSSSACGAGCSADLPSNRRPSAAAAPTITGLPRKGLIVSAMVGAPAPAFELRDTEGNTVTLDSLKGRKSLIVFIPFPFTGTCEGELCAIRDRLADLNALDANVVAISTDTVFSNAEWSKKNGFGFRVLSDFWPHGAVTEAYGAFDPKVGAANRATYVLDADGVVRAIVATESRKIAREFDAYVKALKAIG